MSYDSESDYILLKEIQKGNHSAFSKLVNIYTTRFYSMAYRYLNNQQDAEDIVQKAFLKLWKNPYSWTPGKAKFTTWFSRVIINLCLDQLKKRKLVSISENFEFMDQSTLQIEKIIKEERNILVQKAIQQLPTRQKTALILCFLEGYSNKEVATILETTEKAVQSLLLRAKDSLKRQIDITKL